MRKNDKIIVVLLVFFISSCNNNNENIHSTITEDIIISIADEYCKIEYEIYYSSIIQKYDDFFNLEIDLYDYLHEICFSKAHFNRRTFMKKYNLLVNNIPKDVDNIFCEYLQFNNTGYKYFLDTNLITYLYACESIFRGELDKESFDEVNIENVNKVKKLFSKENIDNIEKNKNYLMERIFIEHNVYLDHICG